MIRKPRTTAEQERLNAHMRQDDVLEFMLFKALHAEPATPVQVKAYLTTAPPEVFVLLNRLVAPPSPLSLRDESVHTDPIVQGLIGFVLARKGSPQDE